MANKQNKLSKPSKSTEKLNYKVRFRIEKGGYFVVTNRKRKVIGNKKFNNHDSALEYALELSNK